MENNSRREFLKKGFIGITGLFAVLSPIKFDSSSSFTINDKPLPSLKGAEAQAKCGIGMGCSGGNDGGGKCGIGMGCSGGSDGGGKCGIGMGCSGG